MNHPLRPRPPFPCVPTILLLLALISTLAAPAVRADDLVRQVQEELRKRSLYFGEVDGALSAPTAAALRRYQQRKGFPSTGEPDALTLHSLMIPVPAALAAAAASGVPPVAVVPPPAVAVRDTQPWPNITVLRSDEARRTVAAVENPTADPDARAARPTASIRPPPAAASRRRVSAEEAREFIQNYLRAGQANDPKAELAFYGDRVDYFDEGSVDHRFIENDIARYDRRWPERQFTLLEPFKVESSSDGDAARTVVNFRYQFVNKGTKYRVQGKTDNTWTLAGSQPSELRIVAIKEQRVRE